VDFTQRNVNARVFYEELKAAFSYSNTGYNITVIALGSDIEALDLAEKIAVLINEEKLEKKTTVFVRIRNTALAKEAKSRFGILPQIITFGDDDSLFSYDRIVAPGAEKIAKDRHLCYSVESMKENDDEAAVKRKAIDKWLYTWSEMQRESNVFACLALRTRFHLLGYDIKASDGREKDDSDDFMKKYMSQNEIDYNGKEINGKKIVSYEGTDFHIPETPRTNLAIAEHARWNAYHICNGFVPASKEEFEKESKESLMLRRKHVNVATMKGLSEYAQFRMENEKITTNDADVLRYDYQLMDDAVWMLHRAGYMIIKVNNESEKEK
ncbi:MAG: hypothetical protein J6Q68_02585, partial [Clostridia bacterium]|nr:hypothetical protein [Clostridia bacterium]